MRFNLNLQRLEKKWDSTTGETKIIKNTQSISHPGAPQNHTHAFQGITK